MGDEKRLYVAATSQNDGKTTFSLGLIKAFQGIARDIGFIKPVGQRYVEIDGRHIDEDSVLIQRVCGLKGALRHMSPIAIERGFTKKFLDNPDEMLPELEKSILASYEASARGNKAVIIEGTGHAGVGTTFGLCNARVARLLNAKSILVTTGGIGRPLDEIALNQALFREKEVPIIGVIANKVLPDKFDETQHYLRRGLARLGLQLVGTVPYTPRLTWPSMRQITEELKFEVISGEQGLDTPVSSVIVGAMSLHNALNHVKKDCLVITPGDREDLLLAVLMSCLLSPQTAIAGVILTGNIKPRKPAMKIIRQTGIPILGAKNHTYSVASKVHEMVVKIRETDDQKVRLASSLVKRYVDYESLWDRL